MAHKAMITASVLLLVSAAGRLQAGEMTLPELIAALQANGAQILYSSALVNQQQKVEVAEIDLDTLREKLPDFGLALVERDGALLIMRESAEATPESIETPVEGPPRLETVIVTGSMHRLPYIGATSSAFSFTPETLQLLPTLGADAMRATMRLPGVASVGVSAKPRIRGGLQDELLVIQDGVELLEPFHLADYHSAYSSIDYHTIESLDVYTGGFPSRYGNRMSGVVDIQNEWQQDLYDTDIGISSFANFLHTRGEFGQQKPGNWLLSLRQGDLTDLTDYIDTRSGDPTYKDAAARVSLEWSPDLVLSTGLVYTEDDIVFEDLEENASSRIDTWYGWLGADWRINRSLAGRFTLSALDFKREKEQASFEIDEEDPGKGGFLDHRQKVQRAALRNDWSALAGNSHLEFGWQLEYNRADYDHRAFIDRGELAEILGTESEIERDINVDPDGWSGGIYGQWEVDVTPHLTLQPSLRWDFQNYYFDNSSEQQISPRLGLAYQLNDSARLRVSVGRFHQQEGIHELQVLDGIARFFAPQHSDQAVLGFHWQVGGAKLTTEIYYKKYGDQKGRFENIFNPFVLLPEMEPDRVGLWPEEALVQGFDLDGRFSVMERADGFFRYSYMEAQDRINGEWIDRRWSQQHTVNTGIAWRGETFSLSLALTWHSGWRSTQMPAFVPEDTVIPVESVLNNTVLDEYFSLDIGARKHWQLRRARVEIYADIVNVTDRKNQAGIDFDIEEVDGGYALTPDHETLLGRVPSIGITLSF